MVVVAWLLSLPYGKFFHIVQRPASVGVTLYQAVTHGLEQARGLTSPAGTPDGAAAGVPAPAGTPAAGGLATGACRRCGGPLPSAQFVRDLRATLTDLGQR
ncbi:MAG TPA: hypothetical protein VH257_06315, partial [Chloroflexota bacterium]|nr:hypothetical protein [Chloroflexota bacterium]